MSKMTRPRFVLQLPAVVFQVGAAPVDGDFHVGLGGGHDVGDFAVGLALDVAQLQGGALLFGQAADEQVEAADAFLVLQGVVGGGLQGVLSVVQLFVEGDGLVVGQSHAVEQQVA